MIVIEDEQVDARVENLSTMKPYVGQVWYYIFSPFS